RGEHEQPGRHEAERDDLEPARRERPHERQQPALRRRGEADVREPERLEDAPGDARLELHALRGADSLRPPLGQLARLATGRAAVDRERPATTLPRLALSSRALAPR